LFFLAVVVEAAVVEAAGDANELLLFIPVSALKPETTWFSSST